MTALAGSKFNFAKVDIDGRWIFHLDNHLCQTFAGCERRFMYRHIRHINPKGLGSFKMQVGSWWSLVMKDYYEAFAKHQLTEAFVMTAAASRWVEMKMDDYGAKTAPLIHQEQYADFGGRAGALAMARQYFLTNYDYDSRHIKVIAAESGFGLRNEVKVGENDKVVLYATGIPDLVVLEDGTYIAPMDHKSKDRIDKKCEESFSVDPQLTGYILAVKELARSLGYQHPVEYSIVNLCSRLQPSKPKDSSKQPLPRFKRIRPRVTEAEIDEWRANRLRLAEQLRAAMESGYYAMTANKVMCHSEYMRPCSYRDICEHAPKDREQVIKSNYVDAPEWTPYTVGDTNGTEQ